jgi:peptidoglycan hydrolase-like protein with peptidoglycan-binding domain
MSVPSTARARTSRLRRGSAAAAIVAGLVLTGTAVVAGSPPVPSAPSSSAANVVGLKKGAYGENVRALQQALNRVGIGVRYGVDGYFGSATQASVKAFQNYKGLPVTGVVDAATAAALGFSAGSGGGGTAVAAASSGGAAVLTVGSSGASVRQLQQLLINAGQSVGGGIDGIYGTMTAGAVKRFQQAKGLPVTGAVDAATLQALQAAGGGAPAAPAGSVAQGARGNQVTSIQRALIAAGIPVAGGADGIYGAETTNAVKQFQQARGLPPTGIVDAQTLAALGRAPAAPPAPAAPAAPAAAAAPAASSSIVGLRAGMRGPAVQALQRALMSMGWTLAGGADGVFGAGTQAVLIKAQQANGVPATGVVDDATARLFNGTSTPNLATPAQPAGGGSTAAGFAAYDEHGARVVSLQQALLAAGIPVRGGADGIFGASTASAIMAFQKAKGLPVTGRVDAATAAALGLGATAAPAPAPVPSVALEAKPVQGPCYYGDTWTAARGNGRVHLGVDIAAKEGNQLYAVISGTVTKLYSPATDSLAGNGLRITRADGTYVFYAHLSSLAPGIGVGTAVTAGQLVGYVGKTGNAGVPHLHLEVHPGGGSAVNPYPMVKAIGAC